jgi:ferredoxin--NADP+ reductase
VNKEKGIVKIIFQIAGATTKKLSYKETGEYIQDFVGPLGVATHLEGIKKACIVGGGVGCAIAMPIAEALHDMGADVTSIIGFRSKDALILEDEFKACSDTLRIMTDDGSFGEHGNVTVPLKEILESGEKFDMIITIGPLIMMKYVVETARPYNTPATASMNPIMIDGTGMCGGCRLTLNIDGKKVTKFACVDGPDFNGYEIDFDEAMLRGRMYGDFERHAYEASCNLFNKEVH